MLDTQRRENAEMLTLHKVLIAIVSMLLLYDYYFPQVYDEVSILDNALFSLLGPYNSTDYTADDVYDTLIDLKNFTFKVNPDPCANYDNGLLLMVIVSSNPTNFENRMAIRSTWGKNLDSTKLVFLMGEPDPQLAQEIANESVTYDDIVQGNFVDAYRNMTYKHVMGLKWIAYHCPTAKYILKTDDDVLVNIHALRKFLVRDLSPWGAKDLIVCQLLENAVVQRSYRSKWRVSPVEYGHSYYPSYCAGWAVLYSQDVVFRLLKEAQQSQYFWIDDVHVTGIIAQRVGVPRTPLKSLVLSRHRAHILTSFGHTYVGRFLFGPPDLPLSQITDLWKAIPE